MDSGYGSSVGALRASRRSTPGRVLARIGTVEQFPAGMDLQETAVYSAMKVASSLAPNSASLASLQALLQQRGRTGISYDL